MSFDLAVWEGRRPDSDRAAATMYQRLMDRLESGDTDAPPSAAISAYVEALLDRWPDITEVAGEESPWADGPLIGNAFGDTIYFSMVWSRADEAAAFAAEVAERHGLVCYDPQSERLLPASAERHGVARRSWFRRQR